MRLFPVNIVLSAVIHALVIGTIVFCCIKTQKKQKPVMIDLSLVKFEELLPQPAKPVQNFHQKKTSVKKYAEKENVVPEKSPDTIIEPENQIMTNDSGDEAPNRDDNSNSSVISSLSQSSYSPVSSGAADGPYSASSGMVRSATKVEMEKHYQAEHFRYISDIIRKHTTYPPVAEEMGISGVVIVQFNVYEDGSLGEILLASSSGSKILDNDAVSTVKRSGPFPKPPVPVTLKFPLQYSLE